MDYYLNASEQLESAKILASAGKYRTPISNLCLACELFLKSLAEHVIPDSPLLESHDVIGLGASVKRQIDFAALRPKLNIIRKYFNDSRYPFSADVYTEEFYFEILEIVLDVKAEVDKANEKKQEKQKVVKKPFKNKSRDNH